jgi:hypothetical protein
MHLRKAAMDGRSFTARTIRRGFVTMEPGRVDVDIAASAA